MVLSDTALTNLPGPISFLVKSNAVGMIVSFCGLGMRGLQGSSQFADADDGLQKYILVLSPSKLSQICTVDTNIMKLEL